VSGGSTELAVWLDQRRREVDAALHRFVAPVDGGPHHVTEAMRYSLFAGGKRLRPVLALAAAEAVALERGRSVDAARTLATAAACALELIHTYSLVHDDLPSMDNDTLRRGRPTAHVVYGEGMAILSGDGLLTEAFALLAREPESSPAVSIGELSGRKLRTLALIAEAAGAAGMVGGQAIDLQAAMPGAVPLNADGLREMHARKTGALIVASVQSGAVMAGADTRAEAAVRLYGQQIGLAFQIVDDILDVEGVSADLGKTAGKDAAAGKPTYPALYGLDESRRLAAQCIDHALTTVGDAGLDGQLPALARWVLGRTR
jgi:geranylgeranyl diphosphate synthase type II